MCEQREDMVGHWIRRFLQEYMVTVRNCSIATRQSYRDTYRLLLSHVSRQSGKSVDRILVDDLSGDRVLAFLEDLERERKCSIRTRNQRLAAVVSLAKYISSQSPEHIEWCRAIRTIPFKKAESRQVTYLSRDEIDAIITAPEQSTEQGFRDHVLLRFLYNTGVRADEVAKMKVRDVHFGVRKDETSIVDIMGKGRKQRQCPLWRLTAEELRSIIGSRTDESALFVNRQGNSMTRFGIYELVAKYARKAAIQFPSIREKRPSPHTIRHTTATHLLQSGVDINTVRAWLGHASLETTNIYAEVNMDTKIRALEKCLPANGRKKSRHWREDQKLMAFLDGI